jgi:hypothetical protein
MQRLAMQGKRECPAMRVDIFVAWGRVLLVLPVCWKNRKLHVQVKLWNKILKEANDVLQKFAKSYFKLFLYFKQHKSNKCVDLLIVISNLLKKDFVILMYLRIQNILIEFLKVYVSVDIFWILFHNFCYLQIFIFNMHSALVLRLSACTYWFSFSLFSISDYLSKFSTNRYEV